MNAIPEVQCGWCKQPASNPESWPRLWNKTLPLCAECALNIKQVLRMGNMVAREIGRKLRENR